VANHALNLAPWWEAQPTQYLVAAPLRSSATIKESQCSPLDHPMIDKSPEMLTDPKALPMEWRPPPLSLQNNNDHTSGQSVPYHWWTGGRGHYKEIATTPASSSATGELKDEATTRRLSLRWPDGFVREWWLCEILMLLMFYVFMLETSQILKFKFMFTAY
jgi:hypothetical protein